MNDKKGDNECFEYSVALSRHKEMGSNYNRINKIKSFLKNFDFKNINYPLKKEDYEMFEENNESMCLIVFGLDNESKKLYYHFKSKYIGKRRNKIILLLLENKHYTYVTKPFTKIHRKLITFIITFTAKLNFVTNKIYWFSFFLICIYTVLNKLGDTLFYLFLI